MTKIVAGYWWNQKLHRREYIIAHLPIRIFIYCRWCGNIASKDMFLIKEEHDCDSLEEKYSTLCPCNYKPRNHE